MDYQGVIIEESLENKDFLDTVKIISTKVSQVTEKHQTPDLAQWTMHTVEIPEMDAQKIAAELAGKILNRWYADYKNNEIHYIIFKNKIFRIDRKRKEQYAEASRYGITLGIPDYQVDFTENIIEQ
ncbi:MAG: hypothetical protein V1860_00870 [bacterium]